MRHLEPFDDPDVYAAKLRLMTRYLGMILHPRCDEVLTTHGVLMTYPELRWVVLELRRDLPITWVDFLGYARKARNTVFVVDTERGPLFSISQQPPASPVPPLE